MTMRTFVHFICPNGHRGVEKTSENDQPYSDLWESVTITGMNSVKKGDEEHYVCATCNQPMSITSAP